MVSVCRFAIGKLESNGKGKGGGRENWERAFGTVTILKSLYSLKSRSMWYQNIALCTRTNVESQTPKRSTETVAGWSRRTVESHTSSGGLTYTTGASQISSLAGDQRVHEVAVRSVSARLLHRWRCSAGIWRQRCSQRHMAVKIDNNDNADCDFNFKFCTVPLQQLSVTASL